MINVYSETMNGIIKDNTVKNGLFSDYGLSAIIKQENKHNKHRILDGTSRNSHKGLSKWERYKHLTNTLQNHRNKLIKNPMTVIGEIVKTKSPRTTIKKNKLTKIEERSSSTTKRLEPIKEAQETETLASSINKFSKLKIKRHLLNFHKHAAIYTTRVDRINTLNLTQESPYPFPEVSTFVNAIPLNRFSPHSITNESTCKNKYVLPSLSLRLNNAKKAITFSEKEEDFDEIRKKMNMRESEELVLLPILKGGKSLLYPRMATISIIWITNYNIS